MSIKPVSPDNHPSNCAVLTSFFHRDKFTPDRNMHRNTCYPHLLSPWNTKSPENYEDFIPFTPCLTPASSESSSISSPMLSERNFAIKQEPQPQLPLRPTSNPRILSVGKGSWSVSPQLHPTIMSRSPQDNNSSSPYYTSSASRSSSYSGSAPSFDHSQASPPRKSRRVVPSQTSNPSSYHDTRVLNIPPAIPGDMSYDPSMQAYRGGYSTGRTSTGRSSKGKAPVDQEQSQPRKFRFVSVQSAEPHQYGYGASGSDVRDDSKVYLEEHMEDEPEDGPFEHGPSEYPPRPYAGGEYAASPLRPKRTTGKIPASNLDFVRYLYTSLIFPQTNSEITVTRARSSLRQTGKRDREICGV